MLDRIAKRRLSPGRETGLFYYPVWYWVLPGIFITVLTFGACIIWGAHLGMPVRDPRGGFWLRISGPAFYLLLAIGVDILLRSVFGKRTWRENFAKAKKRWDRKRVALVGLGFLLFQINYLGYRNLKSWVPLTRNEVYDQDLDAIDRLFTGGLPLAEFLHKWTDWALFHHFLDIIYVLYLPLVGISLAAMLALARTMPQAYFMLSAYLMNWSLGAFAYYLIPSVGPAFTDPQWFEHLHAPLSLQLQQTLENGRLNLLADPFGAGTFQSIGAFASLHMSVTLTWWLILRTLGYRLLSHIAGVYTFLVMIATVYLGWHYLLDVVGGVIIALLAWGLSKWWFSGILSKELRK